MRSGDMVRQRASDLLSLEYFEADPDEMPTQVFDQHHILISLKETPHRVENWRGGEHRDFIPESLPDTAFNPIRDWVTYTLDRERRHLNAWVESNQFDFMTVNF